MNLPAEIRIRVVADGKPLHGAFVLVTLRMRRKSDFGLAFGPADKAGLIRVERGDLLREAEKERRMFIMDFAHPETDFSGRITVTPMNLEAIDRAILAERSFATALGQPAARGDQLQETKRMLETLGSAQLSADVECDGSVVIQRDTVKNLAT